MPRNVEIIWTNFTAGELSPRLAGRIQIDAYYNGAETLENFIVHPHGGASRRFGTRFVAEVKDSSKTTILRKFIFNESQAYVLEFGDYYMRIFYQQGQMLGGNGAELVSNGDFSSTASWTLGTDWSITGGAAVKVAGAAASSISQTLGSLVSGREYWVEYQVVEASGGSVVLKLGGTSGTSHSSAGWYAEKITAGSSGNVIITADAAFAGKIDNVSVKEYGVLEVVTPYAAQHVQDLKFAQNADVIYISHPSFPPRKLQRYTHTFWRLDAVSFTSTPPEWQPGNYPGSVGIFEQRLWLAGTAEEPQTLWGSVSSDYEDFTLGTSDDAAVKYIIGSGQVNQIRWLVSSVSLMIGTLGEIFSAGARSTLEPITPTNIRITPQTNVSCSNIQALLVGDAIIFTGRHGKKVYELGYAFEKDAYAVRDITLRAEHITGSGVGEFDWAEDPDAQLWVVRDDGQMIVGTYYPNESVMSWTRVVTQGEFESVCCIPGDGYDEVWTVVKRTIGGATKRFVEVFTGEQDDLEDMVFVDSSLSYSGTATTTLSGLDHLIGETVSVLADGAVHPNCVVDASGEITLNYPASKVHAGLSYTSTLETMRMEGGNPSGTSQGAPKRITRIMLRLHNTVGAKVGVNEASLWVVPFRTTNDRMDTAIPLFTGDKVFDLASGWNSEGRIVIVQEQPLPITVLAIAETVSVGKMVA